MSALGAVLAFEPGFKLAPLLQQLVEVANPLGPHGSSSWHDVSVGLSHCHFWTTPEEVAESQPLSDEFGRFIICLDGRIDNRSEMLKRVHQNGATLASTVSDAELLLTCYGYWQTDVFPLLVGDFAVLIWDAPQQRLICARDALGRRPLVYHSDSRRFVCGTLLKQLFCDRGIAPVLSDFAISDYLVAAIGNPDATFFEGIRRLPAGHWLEARANGSVVMHRFWDPRQVPLAINPVDEFTERFCDLFLQAVDARLRTNSSQIAIHVSGGFDSTAIVSVVHHLNDRQNLGLNVVALQTIAQHPFANEQRYQKEVLSKFPMTSTSTAAEDFWAFRDPGILLLQRSEEPFEPDYAARLVAELETARRHGAQLVFTGDGGDEIGGSSWYLVDRLLQGNIARSWTELDLRAKGRGISRYALLKALVMGIATSLRRSVVPVERQLPPWMNKDFARKLHLNIRYHNGPTYRNPAREDLYQRLSIFWTNPQFSIVSGIYESFGMERRQPFLDRRLFEWALSIPPAYLGEHGRVKAPMRRALAELMPEEILKRADKGNYLHYWDLGMRVKERDRILHLLNNPISAELGYIDARLLRDCYLKYCQGGQINRRQLWNAVTLEKWLRNEPTKRI